MPWTRSLSAMLALGSCLALAFGGTAGAGSAAPDCGTYSGHGCAPPSARVDLVPPTFSHPTEVTNPLFPISQLHSVVLLGHVGNKPFRTETTLLPRTDTVAWNGTQVEVLLSQYMAFVDGRIDEVAIDRYAQADDGSVWYFGEDVSDYRNGGIVVTEGTWLAGRDGPPAMIMPATPRVGDTYRTENVTGVVFEEVTVKSVGKTVDGPRGPVPGAMVGAELHADETHEDKLFAPGYGEFRTAGGGDLEALALAVPTDALAGPEPTELPLLSTATIGILESARLGDWPAATGTNDRAQTAWAALANTDLPPMIAARANAAMHRLAGAVKRHDAGRAERASIDAAQSVLDLRLRSRPVVAIDIARFVLRSQQLRVDAAAGDAGAVAGDVATLEWMRDRLTGGISAEELARLDERLRDLRTATDATNLPAAADHAARLGTWLQTLAGANA